jgi:hypothetical protein
MAQLTLVTLCCHFLLFINLVSKTADWGVDQSCVQCVGLHCREKLQRAGGMHEYTGCGPAADVDSFI